MASQTTTTALDPQTQAYQSDVYGAARNAAGMTQGVDPHATQRDALQQMIADPRIPEFARKQMQAELAALPPIPAGPSNPTSDAQQQAYQQALQLWLLGQSAYGGDAAALAKLINPDLENVIAKSRLGYADAQKGVLRAVDDRFTQARSFGGSRQAIAAGQATADVARAQAQNEAGLRYQATQDAYGRAGNMINLGMGAMDPKLRALLMAQGTPYGTSTTQNTTQNPFSQLMGYGLTAAGVFGGPAGAAAGSTAGNTFLGNNGYNG